MFLGLSLVVLLSGASIVKGLLSLLVGLWLTSHRHRPVHRRGALRVRPERRCSAASTSWSSRSACSRLRRCWPASRSARRRRCCPCREGILNLLPTWDELKACRFAFFNGSIVGFFVGVLPGAGSTIASFISYGIEKAVSKHPEKFGTGVPEGVAAPEGANNADSGGALVPLLTLGLPGGSSTAIMLSALVLWGVKPGPLMMEESPDVFWGLVASMYIGNVMLLVLNLPLVPLFAQILRIPVFVLFPMILGIAMIGAYSASGRIFDLGLLAGFGLLGYLMVEFRYPTAPLILGFVLGDAMERAFRQTLMMSQGDISTFLDAARWRRPCWRSPLLVLLTPLLGLLQPVARRKAAVEPRLSRPAADASQGGVEDATTNSRAGDRRWQPSLLAIDAQAQQFKPSKPIEIVAHGGPGSGNDVFARTLAALVEKEKLAPVRIQVANRPGGGSTTASAYLAGKAGDSHTIGVFTNIWLTDPLVQQAAKVNLYTT